MQLSKRRINKNLENQFNRLFYQLIADIRDPEEAQIILDDLLKNTELSMISRRLAIAYYLDKGRRYEDIKNNLTVSSATVSSVAEILKRNNNGFKIALKKIKAEEWADHWAKKIKRTFIKK